LDRERRLQLWSKLAGCWAGAAALGAVLILLERQSGWTSSLALPLVATGGVIAAAVIWLRHGNRDPDWRELAGRIEARQSELDGRLLTAVQQEIKPDTEPNYFQDRLVREVLAHSARADWAELIPRSRVAIARAAHLVALLLFASVLWHFRSTGGKSLLARITENRVTVTPGDTTLEKGNSLVVVTKFDGVLPAKVDLVIDGVSNRRISLVKSLADPMFGGSVSEVSSNLTYHVEYGSERTPDFKVTVFEYPRLERADADVAFPEYTRQTAKHIKDTRRLSAVEGSKLGLKLQLNKPVVSARLVPKGHEEGAIPLVVETNRTLAELNDFRLESNQTYELRLMDAENRTNKVPAQFVFEALKNRAPEVKLASPRGDQRPSSLEEVLFEGTVWDDFGVQAYGLAYSVEGKEIKYIELGRGVPAKEKRSFQHVLRMEDLGVEPDSLVSWFVWADDLDPTGNVRRTSGDMFFAEVRPFEEVFREGQGGGGGGEQQQQNGGAQGGDKVTKLADLQKQIINATWKLQREQGAKGTGATKVPQKQSARELKTLNALNQKNGSDGTYRTYGRNESAAARTLMMASVQFFGQRAKSDSNEKSSPRSSRKTSSRELPVGKSGSYAEDLTVVRDAVDQALEQAQSSQEDESDPRSAALWTEVIAQMEKAKAQLEEAAKKPNSLSDAVAAEQAAYAALLRLQKQREFLVNRRRNQNQQGGSSREQQMQRQLEQMDLTQSEDRYENQRQAQAPQSPERREQLQVMNRLQELARRQQDLNDHLKELQTALQEARTEQEREEIRRRLKRLQEEEQQMLADTDELRQRMDRPENQSRMADERRQLDQTRNDMQRAAEAASQGAASQALASGTRAQRQLQDMREQLRKENSSQFSDDMRQMRAEARDLARQQEDIVQKMQDENRASHKALSDSTDRKDLVDRLARQQQRLTNLVDRATQISQEADTAEPVLSRQLYDTVRKFSQDTGQGVQDVQEDLLRQGLASRSLLERLGDKSEQDGAKLLETTAELVRQDFLPQASATGQRVRGNLDNLKRGVERAAESVLGDDTEALRLAKQELDQLMEQLQREGAQAAGGTNQAPGQLAAANGPRRSNETRNGSERRNAGERAGQSGQQQQDASSQRNQNQSGGERATETAQSQEGQAGQNNPGEQSGNRSGRSANSQTASANGGQQPNSATPQDGEAQSGNRGNQADRASQENQPQIAQGNRGNRGARDSTQRGGARGGNRNLTGDNYGGGYTGGPLDLDRIFNPNDRYFGGPLTGDNFIPWSDRLREVEEMLDVPELRNNVAAARERARVMRQEFKKDLKKPDWAIVRLQVISPLVEVRDRIAEELARRESTASLVPIDRDPVPNRYSDLVRKYYEELGKDK
jgi:hypothetical protein